MLKQRLLDARERAADRLDPMNIMSQDGFREVGLLFDYPDLVMAVGYKLYQRSMEGGSPAAYVCGSAKIIPFAAAACLHAIVDDRPAPMLVRCDGEHLRYEELLVPRIKRAADNGRRVVFLDTSVRTGATYRHARSAVEAMNARLKSEGQEPVLFDSGYVLVSGWPTRTDLPGGPTVIMGSSAEMELDRTGH
jgi:adenine/guanine phosphoribosyltransferase-like PRPP-binding protein